MCFYVDIEASVEFKNPEWFRLAIANLIQRGTLGLISHTHNHRIDAVVGDRQEAMINLYNPRECTDRDNARLLMHVSPESAGFGTQPILTYNYWERPNTPEEDEMVREMIAALESEYLAVAIEQYYKQRGERGTRSRSERIRERGRVQVPQSHSRTHSRRSQSERRRSSHDQVVRSDEGNEIRISVTHRW